MTDDHTIDAPDDDSSFDATAAAPYGSDPAQPPGAHQHQATVWALSAEVRALVARVGPLEEFYLAAAPVLDELEAAAAAAQAAVAHEPEATDDSVGPGVSPASSSGHAVAAPPEPAAFDFARLVSWVRANVTGVLERTLPSNQPPNWCPCWWEHPEAVSRLEAARRSWVEASAEATGNALAVFWEHLDHQLAMLMGPGGAFARCRDGQHTEGPFTQRLLPHHEPSPAVYADYARRSQTETAGRAAQRTAQEAAPPRGGATSSGGPRASDHRRVHAVTHQQRIR